MIAQPSTPLVPAGPVSVPDQPLTAHFTLHELLFSQTAVRARISEQFLPPPEVVASLRALCQQVLEPLRMGLGASVRVTSGYRCPRLNQKIGGAAASQHMVGEAADILVTGMSTEALFQHIRLRNLPFDQLIQEFDSWVHVSYRPDPRRQALRAVRLGNGKVKYLPA